MLRPLQVLAVVGAVVCPSAQNEPAAGAARVVAAKQQAVVHVYVRIEKDAGRFGKDWFKDEENKRSGVVIDPSGLVLTHWSAIAEAFAGTAVKDRHSVWVELIGRDAVRAEFVARDLGADLVLVKIEAPDGEPFEFFEFVDANSVSDGHPVVAVGHPDGEDVFVFGGALSRASGGVQLGERVLQPEEIVLSDASIRPSDNGGPLLDADGRLVGLCNSKFFVKPRAEPTAEDLAKPSFGVAVTSNTISRTFASVFAKGGYGNRTLAEPRARVESKTLPELAVDRVRHAVVAVHVGEHPAELGLLDPHARERRRGQGSGVCIDSTGLVLANDHVVAADDEDVWVTFVDGKSHRADVLDSDRSMNIAVLRIQGSGRFPFVELGDSNTVIKGEQILAVGNPRGRALAVGVGVLSAINRGSWTQTGDRLQIDAPVDMSNSGGAVVDAAGRVVGIIDAGRRARRVVEGEEKTDTNIGFAIPIERIRRKFRDEFDTHAGSNQTVVTPAASSAEVLAKRESRLTRMVAESAPSLVNVYVSRELPKPETFDPFAEDESRVVMVGQGSGVIIDSSGLALTNWHVVDGGDRVTVKSGTDVEYEAKVLSTSRVDDLALLQLVLPEGETVRAVELGDSDELPLGSTVVAIGNPYGHSNTVTAGVLSAVDQAINIQGRAREFKGLIQTDAAINPGNSGGALLDLEGRLVGINSAGSNADAEVGYAIPVNYVREKFHSKLLSAEKLGSSYLGVIVVDEDGAAVVRSVNRFGPAARAGVQVGDIVRTVAGFAVADRVEFARMTLTAKAGSPISFELDRNGSAVEVDVTPISARAWRIFRQTGIEVEEIDYADEAELIRTSQIAMYRHYTGSPDGEPPVIARNAVRVVQVRPSEVEAGLDLAAGDILLGLETQQRLVGGGTTSKLIGFTTVRSIGECFDRHATKEEHRWPIYAFRSGAVRETTIRIERVY